MARAFRKRKGRYVARLDRDERTLLVLLFDQARTIVEPTGGQEEDVGEPSGDTFTDLMRGAGMSSLGTAAARAADDPDEPEDPAMARLVPSGHREDESIAAEFRHLTAHAVRETKSARLRTALTLLAESGDDLSLDAEQADAVLAAMTDVRLILADRLGLESEEDALALEELPDDDPRAPLAAYYDFLTWFQETLAEALLHR